MSLGIILTSICQFLSLTRTNPAYKILSVWSLPQILILARYLHKCCVSFLRLLEQIPQSVSLKEQKYIVSQFWILEVCEIKVLAEPCSQWNLWGKSFPASQLLLDFLPWSALPTATDSYFTFHSVIISNFDDLLWIYGLDHIIFLFKSYMEIEIHVK